MKKLTFSAVIAASKTKVWKVLWEPDTYLKWTSVFSKGGGTAESDWKEGSKILFLDAAGNGMYSTIDETVTNENISFRHIGEVKAWKEQPINEEIKKWSGSMESYRLTEEGGETFLEVEVEVPAQHEQYFHDNFPKALENIKVLSEAREL